jgi:hypothetical protein
MHRYLAAVQGIPQTAPSVQSVSFAAVHITHGKRIENREQDFVKKK